MYHALEEKLYDSGFTEPGDRIYVVSAKEFREQMQYLFSAGYRTLLLRELDRIEDFQGLKKIVITFDDGHESNYRIAYPILKDFGFKGDFLITTNFVNTKNFLREKQIKFMYDSGMGIGSHGASHRFLADLEPELIQKELSDSKKILERVIRDSVTNFSAPGGRINEIIINLAKENGYRIICTSEPKLFPLEIKDFIIPRYAIRASTSLKDFRLIVDQKEKWYSSQSNRQLILGYLKIILGNNKYEYFRKLTFRILVWMKFV